MAKPASKTLWTNGTPDNRIEPTGAKKNMGFLAGEKPGYQYLNWLIYNHGEWIDFYEDILKIGSNSIIGENGNIGINETNPTSKLTIKSEGLSTSPLLIKASDGSNLFNLYENSGGHAQLEVRDASGLVKVELNTNGNSYLTGGYVGIGTDTPSVLLDVMGMGDAGRLKLHRGGFGGVTLEGDHNGWRSDTALKIITTDPFLQLKDNNETGAGQDGYIEWRDANDTRTAFLGYYTSGNQNIWLGAEAPGADLILSGNNAVRIGEYTNYNDFVIAHKGEDGVEDTIKSSLLLSCNVDSAVNTSEVWRWRIGTLIGSGASYGSKLAIMRSTRFGVTDYKDIVINENGNIGLGGETTPDQLLHLTKTDNPVIVRLDRNQLGSDGLEAGGLEIYGVDAYSNHRPLFKQRMKIVNSYWNSFYGQLDFLMYYSSGSGTTEINPVRINTSRLQAVAFGNPFGYFSQSGINYDYTLPNNYNGFVIVMDTYGGNTSSSMYVGIICSDYDRCFLSTVAQAGYYSRLNVSVIDGWGSHTLRVSANPVGHAGRIFLIPFENGPAFL